MNVFEERAALRARERRDREALQARRLEERRGAVATNQRRAQARAGGSVITGPTGIAHLADGPGSLNTMCTHKVNGENTGWEARPDLRWEAMPVTVRRCRACLNA